MCVCVRALLLITACSPFSCLADPRGMLFPWQCQVVSLHYSWPCSPAPVQGLSPCSNAIFITHTHIQTVAVREGLMVMLSPWTNKHLITLWSHLNFNWITFPLQGKVSGRKYTNTEHNINTQVPTNLYTENSRETLPLNILWQHLSHLTPHTHTHVSSLHTAKWRDRSVSQKFSSSFSPFLLLSLYDIKESGHP